MNVITLTPPWGSLIAAAAIDAGLGKSNETRSWPLPAAAVGQELAIHQAQGLAAPLRTEADLARLCARHPFAQALALLGITEAAQLPRGAIVAVVVPVGSVELGPYRSHVALGSVARVIPPWPESPEYAFGDYAPGRHAWLLDQIRALRQPLPYRGGQGLRRLPSEVAAVVRAQL